MRKTSVKDKILNSFNKNADITCREISAGGKTVFVFFIECLINNELLASGILTKIFSFENTIAIEELEKSIISIGTVKKLDKIQKIIHNKKKLLKKNN